MNKHVAFLIKMSRILNFSEFADNLKLCSTESIVEKNFEFTIEFISDRVNVILSFDFNSLKENSVDAT